MEWHKMKHLKKNGINHIEDPETGRLYPIPAGGSTDEGGESDEGGEEEEGGAEDEDEDEDEDISGEAMSAEEAKKVRLALKKANKEAAKYRNALKDIERQNESEQEKALRQAREKAAQEVEGKYKSLIAKSEAKAQLRAAGLTSGVDRFANLLDLSEVTVTEDGAVEGLDEQIDQLKQDFPEVFSTGDGSGEKKTGLGGKADGGSKKPSPKSKSSAERLAAYVNG